MPKKPSRQKLDLTHLESLSKTTELDKQTQEPPKTAAPVSPPAPPQEEPAPTPTQETSAAGRQFDKKPQRSEVKLLKTLTSATNAAGEVFKPGDKILVKAPWGPREQAEITSIYQDESGNAWAQYLPSIAIPEKWSWLGGVTRVQLLVKA